MLGQLRQPVDDMCRSRFPAAAGELTVHGRPTPRPLLSRATACPRGEHFLAAVLAAADAETT